MLRDGIYNEIPSNSVWRGINRFPTELTKLSTFLMDVVVFAAWITSKLVPYCTPVLISESNL